MNKTDDILERLRGQHPVIDNPEELTERIMGSLTPHSRVRELKRPVRWVWACAACLLIIIGVGAIIMMKGQQPKETKDMAKAEPEKVIVEEPAVRPEPVQQTEERPLQEKPVRNQKAQKQESTETPMLAESEPKMAPDTDVCQEEAYVLNAALAFAAQVQSIRQSGERLFHEVTNPVIVDE